MRVFQVGNAWGWLQIALVAGQRGAYCMSVTMPDDPLTVSLTISAPNIAGSSLASRACMRSEQVVTQGTLSCSMM